MAKLEDIVKDEEPRELLEDAPIDWSRLSNEEALSSARTILGIFDQLQKDDVLQDMLQEDERGKNIGA